MVMRSTGKFLGMTGDGAIVVKSRWCQNPQSLDDVLPAWRRAGLSDVNMRTAYDIDEAIMQPVIEAI